MVTVLDLFSGIGGFSLGLERAGMRTVAFCEIDPWCRAVLGKHWPGVPVFEDVRTLTAQTLADAIGNTGADSGRPAFVQRNVLEETGRSETASGPATGGTWPVDVICGGFPCQDISVAGKGAGISGSRSGLWSEFARLIGEIRPRYAIVENVAALLGRGLSTVLGDLAEIGYDAQWHVISAADVGAPHLRQRVWIVAHPNNQWELQPQGSERYERGWAGNSGEDVSDANDSTSSRQREHGWQVHALAEPIRLDGGSSFDWWAVEPDVGRVAHGIPHRVDRLKGLGNAVVPQIPEIIGRAIMRAQW